MSTVAPKKTRVLRRTLRPATRRSLVPHPATLGGVAAVGRLAETLVEELVEILKVVVTTTKKAADGKPVLHNAHREHLMQALVRDDAFAPHARDIALGGFYGHNMERPPAKRPRKIIPAPDA